MSNKSNLNTEFGFSDYIQKIIKIPSKCYTLDYVAEGADLMDIGMILIRGLVIIFVVQYFIINIKRLKGHNIFMKSRLLDWLLTVLLIYMSIRSIMDISMKGNSNIRIYIEVILYGVTVYQLLKSSLYKQEVTVENIYKPQLESMLEDIFSKWNLSLLKEKSDGNITNFSFQDQYIESKISVNSNTFSTTKHLLIIDRRNDIPDLHNVLNDIDEIIPPTPKKTILAKFLFKTLLITYIAWKIYQLFN